ncbi:MAG: hypothetical protein H7255_14630 [Ramlibacter sp.]|nr:hypothetical protein [Ramlibacter sp.]
MTGPLVLIVAALINVWLGLICKHEADRQGDGGIGSALCAVFLWFLAFVLGSIGIAALIYRAGGESWAF